MKHRSQIAQFALAALAGGLAGGVGYALASSPANTIHGCVNKGHQLLVQKHCAKGETQLAFNQQGPPGMQGPRGPQGPPSASAWAMIGTYPAGAVVFSGSNITVTRKGLGIYTVSAGGPCATRDGAIIVTPETPVVTPDHMPQAVVTRDSNATATLFSTFDVHIYDNAAGTLTPEDGISFDVAVNCGQ